MKKVINMILLVSLIFTIDISYSQSNNKKDTIYYLLDTLRIPPSDRMINADIAPPNKFFIINCPCLDSGNKPVFRANMSKTTYINKEEFKRIKLIHLSTLIEIVRKNDNQHFDDKYIVFFIEPHQTKYAKQRVFFLGGNEKLIN